MIDTIPCFDAVHDAARFRWAVWQHVRSVQRYVTDAPLDRLRRELAPSLTLRARVYVCNTARMLRAWMKLEGLWLRR